MIPTHTEPPNRQATGEPVRWRTHYAFGIAFSLPIYPYKCLHGVAWDCPRCGTRGSVTLRYRLRWSYYFRCRCQNRLSTFARADAEALPSVIAARER